MSNVALGLLLSLDVTVMVLLFWPVRPLVSNVTSIWPVPPGGISLVLRAAAVHPQEVRTWSMTSGAVPVFFTVNAWVSLSPSVAVPKSFTALSNSILGPLTTACALAEPEAEGPRLHPSTTRESTNEPARRRATFRVRFATARILVCSGRRFKNDGSRGVLVPGLRGRGEGQGRGQ